MAQHPGIFLGFIPMAISAVLFPPSEPSLRRFAFMFLVYIPIYILTALFLSGGIGACHPALPAPMTSTSSSARR